MFKNIRFRTRLILSNFVLLFLMITIAAVVYQKVNLLVTNAQWVTHTHRAIEYGQLLKQSLIDAETGVRGFVIVGKEEFLEPYYQGKKNFQQAMLEVTKHVGDNPVQVKLLEKIDNVEHHWLQDFAEVVIEKRRKIQGDLVSQMQEVIDFMAAGIGKKYADEIRILINEFADNEMKLLTIRNTEAENSAYMTIHITLVGTALAIIFGFVVIILLNRSIMVIVNKIVNTAFVVNYAAGEIAQGNTDLSQRTEEQAASLEETSSSMVEMTTTVQRTAENTRGATKLSATTRDLAQQGGQVVNQAVAAMAEINTSSKQVADIINVMDEIAFQTNLLALNAAVEAARAGDQGRGFAVVAGEVRNLAQRSATAAKQIKNLIQDSVNKVAEGTRLVNQSGTTLVEIVAAAKKVNDIISEIASASQEQALGITQVNQAVAQMEQMIQQNAALVEQAAAASESLKEQSENLKEHITFFGTIQNEKHALSHTTRKPLEYKESAYKIHAHHSENPIRHSVPKINIQQNNTPQKNLKDSEEWDTF